MQVAVKPRGRVAWRAIAAVWAAFILAYSVLTVIGFLAHQTSHVHELFTTPIRAVDVRTNGGPIIVRTGTGSSVTVDATLERGLTKPSHSEEIVGDRLVLDAKCPPTVNVFCRVTYAVRVPVGTSVSADSGGESVTILGSTGPVDVTSGGGNVVLSGVGATIRVDSGGGSVIATGLDATSVSIESGGGNIHMAFESSPTNLSLSSGGGSVAVGLARTEISYRVDVSSGGGPVSTPIRTDPAGTNRISVSSGGGGVHIFYRAP